MAPELFSEDDEDDDPPSWIVEPTMEADVYAYALVSLLVRGVLL
jgi:hypothetical protein